LFWSHICLSSIEELIYVVIIVHLD